MFSSQENSPFGIVDEALDIAPEDFVPYKGPRTTNRVKDMELIYFNQLCRVERGSRLKKVDTAQNTNYVDFRDDTVDLADLHSKVVDTPVYRRTLLKDVASNMANTSTENFENTIVIPEDDMVAFKDKVEAYSSSLTDHFRDNYLPSSLSFDHAAAYIEAFVRDGLGLEGFAVEGDLTKHIGALIKLDTLYRVSKNIKLPKTLRSQYLTLLTNNLFEDAVLSIKGSKKQALLERYKLSLDNPVGVVQNNNPLGSLKLRSAPRNGRQKEE